MLAPSGPGVENPGVRTLRLHGWDLTPREAAEVQVSLRDSVIERRPRKRRLRRIAGCDCSVRGEKIAAVAVVLDADSMETLEWASATAPLRFPYVPGLLSFREVPVLLEAFERLGGPVDAVLCDGQGRAHPRRFGLACHLGLLLDRPTVGVAKSRLVGEAREPSLRRGASTRIIDQGETVGRFVRTREGVRPLWISVGHKIDLETAVALVLRCGRGFRLPEPTRRADRMVGDLLRAESARMKR